MVIGLALVATDRLAIAGQPIVRTSAILVGVIGPALGTGRHQAQAALHPTGRSATTPLGIFNPARWLIFRPSEDGQVSVVAPVSIEEARVSTEEARLPVSETESRAGAEPHALAADAGVDRRALAEMRIIEAP